MYEPILVIFIVCTVVIHGAPPPFDQFHSIICRNGQIVLDKCICDPLYTGPRCERQHIANPPSLFETDLIQPIFCHNGGQMSPSGCQCQPNYSGRFCEIKSIQPAPTKLNPTELLIKTGFLNCESLHCQNDGVCVRSLTIGYECECVVGFTGQLCEKSNYSSSSASSSIDPLFNYLLINYDLNSFFFFVFDRKCRSYNVRYE